jgi:hypothetical protein
MCTTIFNTSLESRDSDLSNAILFASIAGLVVELQRIKQGTSKITNQSQAVIQLV